MSYARSSMGAATVTSVTGGPSGYDCTGANCSAAEQAANQGPPGGVQAMLDAVNSWLNWGGSSPTSACARVAPSVDGTQTECLDASGNVIGTVNPVTGAAVDASGQQITGGTNYGGLLLIGGLALGAYYLLRKKRSS